MSNTTPLPEGLRFGRFELRPHEHRLLADGHPVPLGGRAFDLLLALVQRPGQLITRNELIEQVWPSRVVEENNLTVQVNALRKVLGSDWLVTVPGRGYRFVAPHAPTGPAAAAVAEAVPSRPRTNLPTLQPLLIGRSDDLAALGTLIDQHRLVTVVGAGGMGKTRLVQALMQMRANAYPQGVCWVELGNVTTPEALPLAVAAALGLQSAPGDALAHLARSVVGLQMLIALDNAEHLLDDVARLAQALLDAEPGLRLVATSQAPLRLAPERVFRLGPLAIPQGTLPAQQAQAFGAVALFCERAAAADHRFVLDDAEVPAVIELCQHLDGVALAIELAAARAPALGMAQLLHSLTDRLQVFNTNRNRLAPARQQSLRAALAWSVGLLAPFEQQLFRRLAVVAGSASLSLVQHVGTGADGDPSADPWAIVDALDQLIQRSLVEVVHAEGRSPSRYRLLESPRALALEQLAAAGEEGDLHLRFAQGVLAELGAARAALHAGKLGVQDRRRQGELEMDNARAALAHVNRAGMPALELALASAMMPAALNGERLALADRCEHLIAASGEAGEPLDSVTLYEAWREISVSLANMRPHRSLVAAQHALALARTLDATRPDRYALYDALCAAGQMLVDDDAAAAERLVQEARTLEDPNWPPVRLLPGLRVQASIATARGEVQEALRLYRRLLDVGHAAGDSGLTTQLNIANAELSSGDAAAAVASGTRLVALIRSMRNENLMVFARVNLAAAHLMLHQTQPARLLLQEALPAAMRVPLHAWCVGYLAQLAALEGRHEAAARLVGATTARYEAADEQRQVNEQRAHEHTLELLRTVWDAAALEALMEQGRSLADGEVAELGLGAVQRP
ncbi:helix-turn-helix transcriptional regulator [Aquincola sp. S2]|uniref:Helix-turn-helix transcriptional regulator n=1 Tax=Pseudaquabacterium terrae TaxID=2732868 RepID=A0ABX2ECF0_9BURK|nr:winged helix-turn-helix domain-containing protein [Aquabacterium terrae]NRF65462.1 helix-turn-helix transcriptional regulator [Aquabacterium terrae]